MKNLLLSAAIGDIAGMPYEFHGRTKNYDGVNLLLPSNTYTDDTVCTFACAEALLNNLDMAENLWKRCREDFNRGFGGRFARWIMAREVQPSYHSFGNGSGMRVSAAGFMARSEEECIKLATQTALPTHDHPEGIKGAVATALAIHYGMTGKDKMYIKQHVLNKYYPEWSGLTYADIQPGYYFDETCQRTIPAAIICFLESKDYEDCLKLSISLGGDADTLAAISGPIAYAYYKEMPEELVSNAKAKLPEWMLRVNDDFDEHTRSNASCKFNQRVYNDSVRPQFTPDAISFLKPDEIFVFGSNLQGYHAGGAARAARIKFGAVMGQGVGLQGQSYAIPTMQGGVDTIQPYVDQFIEFAKAHKELFFYVTRIGCGIAGFKDSDIAPLFGEALAIENICLPESFVAELKSKEDLRAPKSYRLMMYGQCRTFADIVKALNNKKQYHRFEELMSDFGKVIAEYQKRGTVNGDSLELMWKIVQDNKNELFDKGEFHFGTFVQKMETVINDNGKSDIDVIFANRQRAKLLILLKTLNDICRYKDVEQLHDDLFSIATGRFNCGDNRYMGDPLPTSGHYPINFFVSGLREQWDNITIDGVLDNKRLEEVMFANHSRKVEELGIDAVIASDFSDDGPCHPEVFFPKERGTAPVYVKDKTSARRFTKSCGEGKGPRRGNELYEMTLVMPILMREVRKGNYELIGDQYFIPVGTVKKPVFVQQVGRIHFSSLNDKRRVIDDIRRRRKGC